MTLWTGNRSKVTLPNGVMTTYYYDNCNRLIDVNHFKGTNPRAKYSYTPAADGMRQQMVEDISTGGGRTVNYTYDNLNRVIGESCSQYSIDYTYDVVGNRTKRIISANGQCMQTNYVYNDRDELVKETHIDPGVCYWLNDRPVYAYASNGQITHYRVYGSSKNISPLKAYLFGIPTKWSNYISTLILGLLPITFLAPKATSLRGRRPKQSRSSILWRQCLCVLLSYLMLINPAWMEQDVQAAINYSTLSTANWATTNRDIHYYYDENGSCVKKIEAIKDTANPETTFVNKTLYTYDLRNQLIKVEYTTNGTTWDTTTYKYNDDGIRVEKNDNGIVTKFVIDEHNLTGYAQVLEEWTTGEHPDKTYIIGDDVIGEAGSSGTPKYYLYDGQGSVRHHADGSGDLIAYSGCDTFAYDAYGQRVDPLKDTVNNDLFYTGEQWDNKAKMYYLRARYYDPLNGRFNQTDPFAGSPQDPQSLHKYLYCHANPVNGIDPSGLSDYSISGVMSAVNIWVGNMGVRVGTAFTAGGAAIGRLWNAIGAQAQQFARQVINLFPRIEVFANKVTGIDRRIIDFSLNVGNKFAQLEVKYSIPRETGSAMARLIGQINAMVTYGRGQAVVWTVREPTVAELARLQQQVGANTFNQVQFVHGVEGLYQWIRLYFGE